MITREQAEQVFREYAERMKPTYEMHNFQLEQITANDINYEYLEDELYVDLEEEAWLCTYERKYKDPLGGGTTWQWNKVKCYIVEAKPGPYVIE